jgi:hypothetical protein
LHVPPAQMFDEPAHTVVQDPQWFMSVVRSCRGLNALGQVSTLSTTPSASESTLPGQLLARGLPTAQPSCLVLSSAGTW